MTPIPVWHAAWPARSWYCPHEHLLAVSPERSAGIDIIRINAVGEKGLGGTSGIFYLLDWWSFTVGNILPPGNGAVI